MDRAALTGLVIAAILLLAGCVEAPATFDASPEPPTTSSSPAPTHLTFAPPPPLKLINVTREQLLETRLQVETRAGEWAIVRLITTPEIWGEDLPWDGDADLSYAVWAASGKPTNATLMYARKSASVFGSQTDQPPSVQFAATPVNNSIVLSGAIWVSASTSGDMPPPPKYEFAWLLGSHETNMTFAVALTEGFSTRFAELRDEILARPTYALEADDNGNGLFGGLAYRLEFGGVRLTGQSGSMRLTESRLAGAGHVEVQRTTKLTGNDEVTEPGLAGFSLYSGVPAGTQHWHYGADFAGKAHRFGGIWAQPGVTRQTLVGLAPPSATGTLKVNPGPAAISFDETLTGVTQESVGLLYSILVGQWGYASVDLGTLYGWKLAYGSTPEGGLPPPGEDQFVRTRTCLAGLPVPCVAS